MFSRFLSFATSLIGGLVIICWPSSFFVVTLSWPRKMGECFSFKFTGFLFAKM